MLAQPHAQQKENPRSPRFQRPINYSELMLNLDRPLGKGGFGVVYRGVWRANEIAVKQLLLEGDISPKAILEFQEESNLMAQLSSPNIVQFYGYCMKPKHSIVMEFMPKGSLFKLLQSDEPLAWPQRLSIALDVSKGLLFLHHEKILHRDIKSLNVLLDNHFRAKLTDFGLSKIKAETRSHPKTTKNVSDSGIGTMQWMAPELLKPRGIFTNKSDIYSLGMTFWEIASRNIPFATAASSDLIPGWVLAGEREEISADCPIILANLIQKCWDSLPDNRPNADAVVTELKRLVEPAPSLSLASGPVYHFASSASNSTPDTPLFKKAEEPTSQSSSTHSNSSDRSKQVTWAAVEVANQARIDASQEDAMQGKLTQLFVSSEHFAAIVALRRDKASRQAWVEWVAESVKKYKRTLLKNDDCDDELHDAIAEWFKLRLEEAQNKAKEVELKQEAQPTQLKKQQEEEQRKIPLEKAKQAEETQALANQEKIKASWISKLDPKTNTISYYNIMTQISAQEAPEGYKPEGAVLEAEQEKARRASYALDQQKRIAEIALREAKDSKEVEVLLNHVAQGEQDQAETLLKANPKLTLCKGTVTDLSKRTFKDITAFQYALWALDWHMWKMLLNYISPEAAAIQFQELEDKGTVHGKHFNLTPLIEALNTYVQQVRVWEQDENWAAIESHWCKQVGGAQLLLPAHVINEYCRLDRAFAPCPSFTEEKLPRMRNFHYEGGNKGEWFASVYKGSTLGISFGAYRSSLPGARGYDLLSITPGVVRDRDAMQCLWEKRNEQLLSLKNHLSSKHTKSYNA